MTQNQQLLVQLRLKMTNVNYNTQQFRILSFQNMYFCFLLLEIRLCCIFQAFVNGLKRAYRDCKLPGRRGQGTVQGFPFFGPLGLLWFWVGYGGGEYSTSTHKHAHWDSHTQTTGISSLEHNWTQHEQKENKEQHKGTSTHVETTQTQTKDHKPHRHEM